MKLEWVIEIRDQCIAARVPFFLNSGAVLIKRKVEEC